MFLTLDQFLEHFPIIQMTKQEFAKKFKIMYSQPQSMADIFNLVPNARGKVLIKKPETDKRYIRKQEVIDYFYEIVINNRHKYLSCFYKAYFEFKDPRKLDWKSTGKKILSEPPAFEPYSVISSQKNDASRRLIRNLFYLELLDLTQVTNTVKSHVSFWESLTNMYNKLQLEDRFFAPSSIDLFLKEKKTQKDGITINYNNLYYLFQAYQPKASIFNPYTIKWIMDNILVPNIDTDTPAGELKILTPVLSWGSYIVAFMHNQDFAHYVGIDVMSSVCKKCEFLGDWYNKLDKKFSGKTTEIYCQPSETMSNNATFMKKYGTDNSGFDCVLVCPPYYDMEIYHEGEQSIETYKDYKSWLKGYWGGTVDMCCSVSKPGSVFAFIGNDYQSLDGKKFPLTEDLHQIVSTCYEFVGMIYLQNRTSPLRVNAKDRTERLFLYRRN